MAVQFVGLVVLYAARFTLPVSIVSMAEELRWDKRQCVSVREGEEEGGGWWEEEEEGDKSYS